MLDAIRESKPWVAMDAGCIDEMPGGLCVKTENEMAEAMSRMAKDNNLRASLGAAGRAAVETTYNLDCHTESYCKLVEELLASKV